MPRHPMVEYYFILLTKFDLHVFFIKKWQLSKNETENSYYKVIKKCDRSLSQSASGITKCDRLLLQSASDISMCNSYYKVRRNSGLSLIKLQAWRLESLYQY